MRRLIIGAGIYGLYAAYQSGKKGHDVVVLEMDNSSFNRGSYVNQARLHEGGHYPRSVATATHSRDYFFRFMNDFYPALNKDMRQLYAISSKDSLTTREEFIKFCDDLNLRCEEVDNSTYFKEGTVDGLWEMLEFSIDCKEVRNILIARCSKYPSIRIVYNQQVKSIARDEDTYVVKTQDSEYIADWVLNATYASTNQISSMLNLPLLNLKYELCEVILCNVSENLKNVGLTIMDGPFFSIMPFGNTGLHSLTSVQRTPHVTSMEDLPTYACQKHGCTNKQLGCCLNCLDRPKSAWEKMSELASSYLNDDIKIEPVRSLFTVKPILKSCEKDDARPTIIKTYEEAPNFITVFSGKLNTIYDLDEVL